MQLGKKIIIGLWIFLIVAIAGAIFIFSLIANGKIGYMPPIEELQNPKNKFATEIYSADHELLGRYFNSTENFGIRKSQRRYKCLWLSLFILFGFGYVF